MKKLIIVILFFAVKLNAQTKFSQLNLDHMGVVSPKRDTLFLPDEQTSIWIKKIWKEYPLKDVKTPKIIILSDDKLLEKYLAYSPSKNKKNPMAMKGN